ncbi:hypothetical protein GCM10007916_30470 [Psychromonas marina]|uniref:Dynamin N-terminal domain-containing protein n=1 Tax=Psychromonas marina TaxID=88364 RepID=A0ABQ6E3Q7_9GAMM|nr:dynamin family protein [Psychromonas marina]GLS91977.1 hypothetical protein GCM10007916_30470 [Psychromonas marina]
MRDQSLANFLVNSRKRAELSQEEAAERCSLVSNQKMISRIESSPLDFVVEILLDYISAVGANRETFWQLLDKPKKLLNESEIKMNTKLQNEIDQLVKNIDKTVLGLNDLPEHLHPKKLIEKMKAAKNDVGSIADTAIIGVMGPSDSGKSHILNLLMGVEIAPEGFQPMTAASTLFVHMSKKPKNLEEAQNVVVFKYEHEGRTFNLGMLNGEHEQFVLAKGDYKSLEKYGARDDDDNILYPEAYLAIVYVDAHVLKKVSLLDTPGQLIDPDYANKEEGVKLDSIDVRKAYEAMGLADSILFTSSVNKFLRDNEPEFYSNILRAPGNLPLDAKNPLKNITILATQAAGIKSIANFNEKTSKRAAISFHKAMGFLLYEDWQSQIDGLKIPTAKDWESRMLPFWDDNKEFMSAFTERFNQLADETVATLSEKRLSKVVAIRKNIISQVEIEMSSLTDKLRSNEERLEEVKMQDARFRKEVVSILEKFKAQENTINELKLETIDQVKSIVGNLKSEEFMAEFIGDRFEDKKSAKQGLSDAIGQYLETKCKKIIDSTSKRFVSEVEYLVNEFSALVPTAGQKDINSVSRISKAGYNTKRMPLSTFDGQSAFIGGMSGVATFGAMGAYVATISSNLGAYILVGQAAGVLTSLGITGSVTTLPWLVGATGGPVVWGAMLAAAVGYLVFRIFSDWKKSMAKSVVKGIDSNEIIDSIEGEISTYWSDTAKAFEFALKGLRDEADKHIKQLYKDAEETYDVKEINNAVTTLEDVISTLKTGDVKNLTAA